MRGDNYFYLNLAAHVEPNSRQRGTATALAYVGSAFGRHPSKRFIEAAHHANAFLGPQLGRISYIHPSPYVCVFGMINALRDCDEKIPTSTSLLNLAECRPPLVTYVKSVNWG